MANPVGFEGSNFLYTAPSGEEESIRDLPAFISGMGVICCWRLTQEELEEVQETGVVWVSLAARNIPPVAVSGHALVTVGGRDAKAEPYFAPPGAK